MEEQLKKLDYNPLANYGKKSKILCLNYRINLLELIKEDFTGLKNMDF